MILTITISFTSNKDASYPSYVTIGEAIGKTKNSVMQYVHGLEEKQLIYTEPTTVWGEGGLKRNGNLHFTIRPIEEAKRYHVEQQMLENNGYIFCKNKHGLCFGDNFKRTL